MSELGRGTRDVGRVGTPGTRNPEPGTTHSSLIAHRSSLTYDVVMVGGRCAGSAAAIGLGRAGYRVLLVERQEMPSDTLSTHVIWPDGLGALKRLGLLDPVLASGAPPARHFRLCRGDDELLAEIIPFDGIDTVLCVRRIVLDGILWEAAANTPGVDARDHTAATGLRWEDGRVVGVDLRGPEGIRSVSAGLVVGADGRGSLVAREVGAVEEDVVPPGRYWYYGYFRDASVPGPVALTESDTERDTVVTMPTNDGRLMVGYSAFDEDFDDFRRDYADNYLQRVRAHPWGAQVLEGATLASPVLGMSGIRGYYRTPYGPGWVLVGDAVHQKDPIVARGLNEALRGAEWLVDALRSGISDDALDAYARTMRERTESKALNARMLMRPDRYMTPEQAAILTEATSTPEGLAQYLRVEYDDAVHFDEFFAKAER